MGTLISDKYIVTTRYKSAMRLGFLRNLVGF